MKITPFESYEIVFDALLEKGYTETEAEQIICDIIEDLKEMDNIALKVHSILQEQKKRVS